MLSIEEIKLLIEKLEKVKKEDPDHFSRECAGNGVEEMKLVV